jgi:chaperonin GroES
LNLRIFTAVFLCAIIFFGCINLLVKQYINQLKTENMNIKPLADRVLVKPVAAEEKTISGIIIPDSAKEKPLKGEVMAVGNGTKDEEMVVAVGNTVLYGKYAGQELEWEGVKYLIMKQSDILAII